MTPPEIKKELVKYIEAIRSRQYAFSFRIVNAQLKKEKMPTARGYDELVGKYKNLTAKNKDLLEYLAVLKRIHNDSILYSRRAVSFYEITLDQAKNISHRINLILDKDNLFIDQFPLPVSKSVLSRAGYNGKFVESAKVSSNRMRIVACSKRSYREREPIQIDTLEESARLALDGYDEIVGVKHGIAQAYDYVEIDVENGMISLHLDICCPLTPDDFEKARIYFAGRLNDAFGELYELNILSPKNLLPFVQTFYDQKDGKVARLGHATGTDSVKDERMRGRGKDLRFEPFHQKGLEEIKTTDAYSIKKTWPIKGAANTPCIELLGHFTDIDAIAASINYAILDQCSDENQYHMLLGKLT